MAWLNIYQNLEQIIQDAIAPEIQSIKGEIKGLQTQIRALEKQVSGLRTDFRSFHAHTEKRFDEQNRQWEIAMDIRERLAVLEAQIKSR